MAVQGQEHAEGTAAARLGVNVQFAMHGVGQTLAQGQSQAGATKAPRNLRIGLGERRKNVP